MEINTNCPIIREHYRHTRKVNSYIALGVMTGFLALGAGVYSEKPKEKRNIEPKSVELGRENVTYSDISGLIH